MRRLLPPIGNLVPMVASLTGWSQPGLGPARPDVMQCHTTCTRCLMKIAPYMTLSWARWRRCRGLLALLLSSTDPQQSR